MFFFFLLQSFWIEKHWFLCEASWNHIYHQTVQLPPVQLCNCWKSIRLKCQRAVDGAVRAPHGAPSSCHGHGAAGCIGIHRHGRGTERFEAAWILLRHWATTCWTLLPGGKHRVCVRAWGFHRQEALARESQTFALRRRLKVQLWIHRTLFVSKLQNVESGRKSVLENQAKESNDWRNV